MKPTHNKCDTYMAEGHYCSGYIALREELKAVKALLKEASDNWVPHPSNLSAAIVDLLHIPPPSPWRDRDD